MFLLKPQKHLYWRWLGHIMRSSFRWVWRLPSKITLWLGCRRPRKPVLRLAGRPHNGCCSRVSHNAQTKLLLGLWHENHSTPLAPMDQPQILRQLLPTSEERTTDCSDHCRDCAIWHWSGRG